MQPDILKMEVLHADIWEDHSFLNRSPRTSPVRAYQADDFLTPLVWSPSAYWFGSTLTGVGALQAGRAGGEAVLFARNGDGQLAEDAGEINTLTVFRWATGAWGHQLVHHPGQGPGGRVHSRPALAYTGLNWVVAWHDHEHRIWVSRTIGGNPQTWTTNQVGATNNKVRTAQTPGIAHLASNGALYLFYVNHYSTVGVSGGSNPRARMISYVASLDGGATWQAPVDAGEVASFISGGVSVTCMNVGGPYGWPCSIAYVDLNTQTAFWRPARPRYSTPSLARWLDIGPAEMLGSDQSLSSRTPAVTTGPTETGGGWLMASVYDRNADPPVVDYAARVQQATAPGVLYDQRSLFVGGGQNQSLVGTFPLMSGPSMAHLPGWNLLYLFHTREY
ncbi:MAG: sialidase family protein [bacterium]